MSRFELNTKQQKYDYLLHLMAKQYSMNLEIETTRIHLVIIKRSIDRIGNEIEEDNDIDSIIKLCLNGR